MDFYSVTSSQRQDEPPIPPPWGVNVPSVERFRAKTLHDEGTLYVGGTMTRGGHVPLSLSRLLSQSVVRSAYVIRVRMEYVQ